ncbi:hypothetical protein DRJ22_06105 [Candidatus Woesearchaeota archaeon]|nr:MAG: hypothetical protein DRJ22_06105 [Candidatus Woesearchaeota archaeon]
MDANSLEVGEIPTGLLDREMKEIEAKICVLLAKKSGKWIIPPSSHHCNALAGILGKKPQNLRVVLDQMIALGWLKSKKEEHGRRIFYSLASEDALRKAMNVLGIKPQPKMIKCPTCGSEYSSLLTACPHCAKEEADAILRTARQKPEKPSTALLLYGVAPEEVQDLQLPSIPEEKVGTIAYHEGIGQVGKVRWVQDRPTTGDLNALSRRNRKKRYKEAKKFADWCKTQRLRKKELLALRIMVDRSGNLIGEEHWDFRAHVMAHEEGSAVRKAFRTRKEEKYLENMLLETARDLAQRYATYLESR